MLLFVIDVGLDVFDLCTVAATLVGGAFREYFTRLTDNSSVDSFF